MVVCRLVEKHKFGLLEIHESYETYLMRREQTAEVGMATSYCVYIDGYDTIIYQ